MLKRIRVLIPYRIKKCILNTLYFFTTKITTPRMVWGYSNPTSKIQCPNTRVSNTVIFNHQEKITLNDNVYVGHFSILDGTGGLIIEEGVQLAGWNGIYTHSSHISIRLYGKHYQDVSEDKKIGYIIKPVTIGKYAFIGAGAIVLPGVSVGKGSLVAAGSIVKNNVDAFQIVSGNPAVAVGSTKKIDAEYLLDPIVREWYEEWQLN